MSGEINMRSIQLLEEFENKLELSKPVPLLPNMIMVRKDEIIELIREINITLPDEYQQIKWMKSQQSHIIEDAHMNAEQIISSSKMEEKRLLDDAQIMHDRIIREAQERARELVNESAILAEARHISDKMLKDAERMGKDIIDNAYVHVHDLLLSTRSNLSNVLDTVNANLSELGHFKR
jgi:cell division septum initiation protein DivIVA